MPYKEGMTEGKTMQSNLISKQTEPMSINQSDTEISTQNASNKINPLSDKNMCDDADDCQVPNISVCSIDKADSGHIYENSTQITATIIEAGLSKPTQTVTIEQQPVAEAASYVCLDNYISFLSVDEISESGLFKPIQTMSSNPQPVAEAASYVCLDNYISFLSVDEISESGLSKPIQTMSINTQPVPEGASYVCLENYIRIIDVNDLVNKDIRDKDETDGVSIHDNNTQISNTIPLDKKPLCKGTKSKKKMKKMQPHIMTNKCKLALTLLVGLVITVPVVCLIVWGVKARYKENKKAEPATNLTTFAFPECWDNSVNYSKHCNNSLETELIGIKENNTIENISLLMRQETITRSIQNISQLMRQQTTTSSGQNDTSPANHKIPASIGFTAWATSVVSYSAGTTLIFNGMDEPDEEQDGFDQGTGIFTCPITGIYYVYVTLRKNNLTNIYVDVFKMDTRIIRFSENYTGSPWNTVSNSALVSCSMGEIIQMKGWSSGSIYGEANVRCSSFAVINVDHIAENSPDDTFVGYSGYANSKRLSHGDPINFPNPLCNVGNHFSSNRFTCPYTGIYFVGVTYWQHPSTSRSYDVAASVYRVDTEVLRTYHGYKDYNYVTNNALVRCNRGEYIESKSRGTSYLYGSGSYPESIFTVMSVHQEDSTRPFIGFSRSKTDKQRYSAGDVITFTGIIMDEGNYFKSNQFVCPVDGSYYFLLNLWKYTGIIQVYLKHDERTVFKLEDSQIPIRWDTISNSAVIRCLKGEVVKAVAARRGNMHNSRQTTFSGF